MNIGMIGMAVMGSNLALNMADKGFRVSCYNYTPDLTEKFIKENPHQNLKGFFDFKEFVNSLEKPRKIMLLIMAGAPVDSTIESLIPLLEQGDIILDGGNSFFEDTIRRHNYLKEKGIHYFGVGISGGEKGARYGAAIMPAGDKQAYELVKPIYEAVAAKAEDQKPCCTYIGTDGAGHYVKMVHNGIEYADMQLIAESYLLLKNLLNLSNAQIAEIFNDWNKGELKSFLIGITADIFADSENIIDEIVDSAGQKGTGRWTSIAALKQGVNISIITAACNARITSNLLQLREELQTKLIKEHNPALNPELVEEIKTALYLGKIAAYAQGFSLYQSAQDFYGWDLNLAEIASIFRAGCIIQADFLNKISLAYQENPQLKNLVLAPFFLEKIQKGLPALRKIVSLAVLNGIPIPAFVNAISYFDALSAQLLGANLIQAQRDYFGAHTFQKKTEQGNFHHQWKEHFIK